jgi:hypothetical protein
MKFNQPPSSRLPVGAGAEALLAADDSGDLVSASLAAAAGSRPAPALWLS